MENGKMEIRNGKLITLYKIEKILSILNDDIQVGESAFYWMLDINKMISCKKTFFGIIIKGLKKVWTVIKKVL